MTDTIFFRLLADDDKDAVLSDTVEKLNEDGGTTSDVYLLDSATFRQVPDSPFAYWVSEEMHSKFIKLPKFENEDRTVKQGLATGDDFRFVRTWWEVASQHLCTTLSSGNKRPPETNPLWVPHVKAGASQPWFSPITVVVNWGNNGAEIRSFYDERGKLRSRPQNIDYYFRPGFSWTRRAVRFIPYAVPRGCIPTVSRYIAFPEPEREFSALGLVASNVATAFLRFYGEWFTRPNYLVDNLKSLPWPTLSSNVENGLRDFVSEQVNCRRKAYQQHEPFLEFTLPALLTADGASEALMFDFRSLLTPELEVATANSYGIDRSSERVELERDLLEAVEVRASQPEADLETADEDDASSVVMSNSPRDQRGALLSYTVGCVFGRWDTRLALDPSLAPKLQDPFAPLPVCSPGMLVGPDGLPAQRDGIASEEWMRARPTAITPPPDGSVENPTIPDSDYPLAVDWDGILVDDPDHPDDILRRVRDVLELVWGGQADEIEHEACGLLGVKDLRTYFRNPRKFWDFHVKRYSKSRRKAPIYWLLQSPKKNFGLWIYYHRLDPDILFKALTKYVEPKIRLEETRLEEYEARRRDAGTGGREAKQAEKAVEDQEALLADVREFRDRLQRAAGLYLRPDLNDGVVLNIAPLHELVPWKEAKSKWNDLLAGKYEWSSIGKQLREKGLV